MKDNSIVGFLFQKPTRTTPRPSAPIPRRATPVPKPVDIRSEPKPFANSFTIDETEILPPPPSPTRTEPGNDTPAVPQKELPPEIENAADMVHQIREALLPQGDYLSIPAEALLAKLPPTLRGPRWPGTEPTGTNLLLDRDTLLQKLRCGVVSYQLGEFLPDLIEGWAVDAPEAEVRLDLPTVVKAIPPALFGPDPRTNNGAAAAPDGRDYFVPAQPDVPLAPPLPEARIPAAEQKPAQGGRAHLFGSGTGPKRQVVPTHIPGAWNGIEAPCSVSVGAVDINTAGQDELQRLPGVGPERARMILDNRARGGKFDGIYDLLRIRGVGRKSFSRLTGLSLRRRDRCDRHEVLNKLIGLPADSRPGLADIVRQVAGVFAGAACTLVAHDGELLASSETEGSDTSMKAALVPMLFRRSRRYLHSLAPGASDCVVLPLSDNPLLLFSVDRFFLMLELPATVGLEQSMPKAVAIARELTWLMGPRAVVR